jgi:MoaA/NifB/PqqE/SkfB family radical SAM enzyme
MGLAEGLERRVLGLLSSLGTTLAGTDAGHRLVNSEMTYRVLQRIIGGSLSRLNDPTDENILWALRKMERAAKWVAPDKSDRVYESAILGAMKRAFESGEETNLSRKVKRTISLLSEKNLMSLVLDFSIVGVGLGALNDRYLAKKGEPDINYLTLQVNSECNVRHRCPGCFAASAKNELSYEALDSVVGQSIELGSRFTVLLGGETLLRKDDVLKLLRTYNRRPFMVATNGILVDDAYAEAAADLGNVITFINTPGLEGMTRKLRDPETWGEIKAAAETLQRHGAPSAFASTIYSANFAELSSPEFVQQTIDWGMVMGIYFNYTAPMVHRPLSAMQMTPEMGEDFSERVRHVSSNYPLILVNTYKGEEIIPCPAAEGRMPYVQSDGKVAACPMWQPPNDGFNVKRHPLREILNQPYFRWLSKEKPICAGALVAKQVLTEARAKTKLELIRS